MAYKITELEASRALENRANYKYALVYMLSEVILCRTEQLKEADFRECTEARFFSPEGELHIFETEDGMQAVEVTDDGMEDCLLKKYELAPKFSEAGTVLVVQEYLDYDEDGQAVVGLTRLRDLEQGVRNDEI